MGSLDRSITDWPQLSGFCLSQGLQRHSTQLKRSWRDLLRISSIHWAQDKRLSSNEMAEVTDATSMLVTDGPALATLSVNQNIRPFSEMGITQQLIDIHFRPSLGRLPESVWATGVTI